MCPTLWWLIIIRISYVLKCYCLIDYSSWLLNVLYTEVLFFNKLKFYGWKISKFNKMCPTLWWLIIISCWISYILKCYCSIDYRFLEEIGSYVDSIDRDSVVKGYQKYRRGLNVTHWLYICNMVTVLCHCVKICHSTWY